MLRTTAEIYNVQITQCELYHLYPKLARHRVDRPKDIPGIIPLLELYPVHISFKYRQSRIPIQLFSETLAEMRLNRTLMERSINFFG